MKIFKSVTILTAAFLLLSQSGFAQSSEDKSAETSASNKTVEAVESIESNESGQVPSETDAGSEEIENQYEAEENDLSGVEMEASYLKTSRRKDIADVAAGSEVTNVREAVSVVEDTADSASSLSSGAASLQTPESPLSPENNEKSETETSLSTEPVEPAETAASESTSGEDELWFEEYLDDLEELRRLREKQLSKVTRKNEKILGVQMWFTHLEKDEFQMGSDSGDSNPKHTVVLDPFMISSTEVPQSLYKMINGKKSYCTGDGSGAAVNVSWYDAIIFCNRLSLAMGYTPCYTVNGISDPEKWGYNPNSGNTISGLIECNFKASGFRLPAEAEWEYAARGAFLSKGTMFAGGSKKDYVVAQGNSLARESVLCNEVGLYDMSGNVAEWCNDWYGMYSTGRESNPEGPSYGSRKVARGGSYKSQDEALAVWAREKFTPSSSYEDVGFRLVRHIQSDSEVTTERQSSAYSTIAEKMEKERKRQQKMGNRRKSLGLHVNAYSNGADVVFTKDDFMNSATNFNDLGLLVGVNTCVPLMNWMFVGFDAQVGMDANSFSNMNKGEDDLKYNVNAMVKFGLNTPLLANKLLRFSVFTEAGLMDFVPAAGVGIDAELLSIITERNLGIGIQCSASYDINQNMKGTLRYGISIEFLFPTIPNLAN